MPVFISEVKKENSTKKKNEHGEICFFINYKFLRKISFKIVSFFVSIVTLCDIFIQDLNEFLALIFFFKIDLSLINKLRVFFRYFLCSFISQ